MNDWDGWNEQSRQASRQAGILGRAEENKTLTTRRAQAKLARELSEQEYYGAVTRIPHG